MNWLRKTVNLFKDDPLLFLSCCVAHCYLPAIRARRGVTIGKGVVLKGVPQIEIVGNGQLVIGDNVSLYSTHRRYFAHFTSPVRLFSEGDGRIYIGDNSRINGATIHSRGKIEIGKNCLIAANTSILDSHGHDLCLMTPERRISSIDVPGEVIIEDSVWIGLNCIVLKGVHIGRGSVVGAGSIVTRDIPSFSVAAGSPAKVLRKQNG